MKFLNKTECPLDQAHSVPIYYGLIKVNKFVNSVKGLKKESEITIDKQVFKGFDKEDVWNNFKKNIDSKMNFKEERITENILYKDKVFTAKKIERTYSLENIEIYKHLGFGVKE